LSANPKQFDAVTYVFEAVGQGKLASCRLKSLQLKFLSFATFPANQVVVMVGSAVAVFVFAICTGQGIGFSE
jgi:hypothetical protein